MSSLIASVVACGGLAAGCGVQAAVNIGATANVTDCAGTYFFRGGEYLRYDTATNRVADAYPKSIAADWRGLGAAGFGSNLDHVVMVKETDKRKLVFVKGDPQVKYDLDDGNPGPRQPGRRRRIAQADLRRRELPEARLRPLSPAIATRSRRATRDPCRRRCRPSWPAGSTTGCGR